MKIEELSNGRKVVDRALEQMGTGSVKLISEKIAHIEFDGVVLKYQESDVEYLEPVS